jgi:hypothetical protein
MDVLSTLPDLRRGRCAYASRAELRSRLLLPAGCLALRADPARARALVSALLDGVWVSKVCRSGRTLRRRVWVTADGGALRWDSSRKRPRDAALPLRDVSLLGRGAVLQRAAARAGPRTAARPLARSPARPLARSLARNIRGRDRADTMLGERERV